jgi:receptor-interacting serine/threonine-protein kinase 5
LADYNKYNKSVDIFSFGIVFWYICDGKGRDPEYAQYAPGIGAHAILTMGQKGKRPERKAWFNNDCWRLMQRCWDKDPDKRPTADVILAELNGILKQTL